MQIKIKKLYDNEIKDALLFIWDMFLKQDTSVYKNEEIDEFYHNLSDNNSLNNIIYYGAFSNTKLIGVIGIRKTNCHICYFFVCEDYSRQLVGTKLFEFILKDNLTSSFTYNCPPCDVKLFHNLGFFSTDLNQELHGISFTPIRYIRAYDVLKPIRFSFLRANLSDESSVMKLYSSFVGSTFCTWDEYYPFKINFDIDVRNGNLYLLFLGDRLIGTGSIVSENELDELSCWQEQSTNVAEIARIAVATNMQGLGLAKEIVFMLEDHLRATGKEVIHLLVAKKNIPAVKTYQKCGYNFVGECFMYGNEYFACEKKISYK